MSVIFAKLITSRLHSDNVTIENMAICSLQKTDIYK